MWIKRPEFRLGLRMAIAILIAPWLLESVTFTDLMHAFVDQIGIIAAQKRRALIAFAVTADQQREMLLQKRQENLARAGLQEQHAAAESSCAGATAARATASMEGSLSLISGMIGEQNTLARSPAAVSFRTAAKRKIRTRRHRFDQPRQIAIESS